MPTSLEQRLAQLEEGLKGAKLRVAALEEESHVKAHLRGYMENEKEAETRCLDSSG